MSPPGGGRIGSLLEEKNVWLGLVNLVVFPTQTLQHMSVMDGSTAGREGGKNVPE